MPLDRTPLISIITLHFNQLQATLDFLDSSALLTYPFFEILVCDMASQDGAEAFIKSGRYRNTKYFRSNKNLGFAGGNNWGLKNAKGDFVFFVNNDTLLNENLLQTLLEPMLTNSLIAAVSPKIRFFQPPQRIQYAGFTKMNMLTGRGFSIGEGKEDRGQFNVSGSTWGVHGCAMMVRRSVIDKTGMFPERFFLYYEEWDWSARALKAGFLLWYSSESSILHKGSLSLGNHSPLKNYYLTRNRILFMRRNATAGQFFIFVLFFTFVSIPKTVIQLSLLRRFRELRFFFRGTFWNLVNNSSSAVI